MPRTASNLERDIVIQSLARHLATLSLTALEHPSVQWPDMNQQREFIGTYDPQPLLALPSVQIRMGTKVVKSDAQLQLEIECYRISFYFPYSIRPNAKPFVIYLPAIGRIEGQLTRFMQEALEFELRNWCRGLPPIHFLMVDCAASMHRSMVRLIKELDPSLLSRRLPSSARPGDTRRHLVSHGSVAFNVVDAQHMKLVLETAEGCQADMILSRSTRNDPEMIRRCFLQRYPPRFLYP